MIELRCSQLPLFALCPSSAQQWEHPVADDSPEAKLGRQVHAMAAAFLNNEELTPASEETTRLLNTVTRVWKQIWQTANDVVVEAPVDLFGDGWHLQGHVDALERGGNRLWDYKSGWGAGDYLWQLRGYAACRKLPLVIGNIVWLRIREVETFAFFASRQERSEYLDVHPEADPDHCIDNSIFAEEITKLVQRIGLDYWAGGHCWRCDGRNECTARADFLRSNVGALVPLQDCLPVSREALAGAWNTWKRIEKLGRILDDMVKAEVASGGPLPGENGTEWAFEETMQEPIRLREAWPVLKARLSDDELFDCLDAEKKRVEAVVKKHAPARGKGKAWMVFLDELRVAGGLGEKVVRSLKLKRIGVINE